MPADRKKTAAPNLTKPARTVPQQFLTTRFVSGLTFLSVVGLLLTGRYAYYYGIPFADTYTYLDPGRNLLHGRGFITTFNVVHGWSGQLSHPGLAYYNSLYGLLLALIWEVLDNAGAVNVVATALPCCLNAVLLALLVWRAFGPLTGILSAAAYLLLPSTWQGLALIAAEHPAVTVLLICLLIIQYYVPQHSRGWAVVGVSLGVGALVKVSVLLAAPGLIAAMLVIRSGTIRERIAGSIGPARLFVLGIAAGLVPFALVCKLVAGEFYPSYPAMAQNWSMATEYGGHYVAASPAVQPDASHVPRVAERVGFVIDNAGTFLKYAAGELGLMLLLVAIGLAVAQDESRHLAVFLVCTGASLAVGHALSFNWLRLASAPSSPARYVLYVAAFWYPVALYGLVRMTEARLRAGATRVVVVLLLWLVASLPAVVKSVSAIRRVDGMAVPRFVRLQRAMMYSARLVGRDELVAVAGGGLTICGAVFLERPVVALPQGRMDTPQAMREFISVFHPAMVIPAKNRSAPMVLPQLGYQLRQLQALRGMPVYLRKR